METPLLLLLQQLDTIALWDRGVRRDCSGTRDVAANNMAFAGGSPWFFGSRRVPPRENDPDALFAGGAFNCQLIVYDATRLENLDRLRLAWDLKSEIIVK